MRSVRTVLLTASVLATVPLQGVAAAVPASCGWYRVPVKTLSDSARHRVDLHPRNVSVGRVLRFHRPPVGSETPRRAPVEARTYRVKATVVQAKDQVDGDVRIVLASRTHPNRTFVAELPDRRCIGSRFRRGRMDAARRRLVNACGNLSRTRWTRLNGRVVVTGVGFWSELAPEDRNTAPNAFELHPLLRFRGSCSRG
jgi:hypothetical protein